jgi:hypothetical protein
MGAAAGGPGWLVVFGLLWLFVIGFVVPGLLEIERTAAPKTIEISGDTVTVKSQLLRGVRTETYPAEHDLALSSGWLLSQLSHAPNPGITSNWWDPIGASRSDTIGPKMCRHNLCDGCVFKSDKRCGRLARIASQVSRCGTWIVRAVDNTVHAADGIVADVSHRC